MATVVVVDRQKDSGMLLKRLLERSGHAAFLFSDCSAALEWSVGREIDVAVLGVEFTRGGWEKALGARLKALHRDVKVMIIADHGAEAELQAADVDDFLFRPIDLDAVEEKVTRLLGVAAAT